MIAYTRNLLQYNKVTYATHLYLTVIACALRPILFLMKAANEKKLSLPKTRLP